MLTGSTGGTVLALVEVYVYIQRLFFWSTVVNNLLATGRERKLVLRRCGLVNSEATTAHAYVVA
jgi:hypothetical protein